MANGFLELLRPNTCVMAGVAAVIGYWVSLGKFQFVNELILVFLTVFFVCGAGQVINDYFDREIDAKRKKERPIPSGRVKAKHAFSFAIGLFFIGVGLSVLINQIAFFIALVYSVLLFVYSAFLSKVKYVGNWVVASGTAFTFIFGSALNEITLNVLFLAGIALFANVAREIIKDLEDVGQDKGFKVTLPMIANEKFCKAVVAVSYLIAIVLGFFIGLNGGFNSLFFLPVFGVSGIVSVWSFKLLNGKNFQDSQQKSKLAMRIALLAFLVGLI